jgi:hypothetical protein
MLNKYKVSSNKSVKPVTSQEATQEDCMETFVASSVILKTLETTAESCTNRMRRSSQC